MRDYLSSLTTDHINLSRSRNIHLLLAIMTHKTAKIRWASNLATCHWHSLPSLSLLYDSSGLYIASRVPTSQSTSSHITLIPHLLGEYFQAPGLVIPVDLLSRNIRSRLFRFCFNKMKQILQMKHCSLLKPCGFTDFGGMPSQIVHIDHETKSGTLADSASQCGV